MQKTDFSPTAGCAKAADRLKHIINSTSIIEYACTVTNPKELELLSKLFMKIGLRAHCRKADVCQCVDFLDTLAEELVRPRFVELHNHNCQQFYGQISDSKFYSSEFTNKRSLVA